MSKKNHIEGLAEIVYKSFDEETDKLAEKIGVILVSETQDVLMKHGKYATANLYQSVSQKVRRMAWGYMITCFTNANYSIYVHEDTRPHFPPVDKIQEWVKVKKLAARYSVKSKKRFGGTKTQHNEDRALAWAIAKSISRKGTKGIKFFELALKQSMPIIKDELLKKSNK